MTVWTVSAGILFLLASWAAPAIALSPAQAYLTQALEAARRIPLGGDQSAARRDIALALMNFDVTAANETVGSIGRPSDAARVLARLATLLTGADPETAKQSALLGGRLLQRINEPERRLQEYRMYLQEIAILGADALPAVQELSEEEARILVVKALAARNPQHALKLATAWNIIGPAGDEACAALAEQLAATQPEEAVAWADRIAAPARRERTLWRIADTRPATEVPDITTRMQDVVSRAGALTSAARRLATDPDAAVTAARAVAVSPFSAQAEVAVALAQQDEAKGVTLARELPEAARAWALGSIAVSVAASNPAQAETYLQEAQGSPEFTIAAVTRMAPVASERALRLAQALPVINRDIALAEIVRALAPTQRTTALELLRDISAPQWRDHALAALVVQLAKTDADAATSLLGLMSDSTRIPTLRARVAAEIAPRDPTTARRLLSTLPEGEVRTLRAYDAACAVFAAGGKFDEAASFAALGLPADLARRWMLPEAARLGVGAIGEMAEKLENPYGESCGLAEAARILLKDESVPRPAPERAQMIRLIVEWEGK